MFVYPGGPDRPPGYRVRKKLILIMADKRLMILSICILLGAGLVSCRKGDAAVTVPETSSGMVAVSFNFGSREEDGADTRISGIPSDLAERARVRVGYLIFNVSGNVIRRETMSWEAFVNSGYGLCYLQSGTTYRVQFYINPDEGDTMDYITSPTGTGSILSYPFGLTGQSASCLKMFGEKSFTTSSSGGTQTVYVDILRLVSRVKVGTVRMNLTAAQLGGRTFTLKRIYLLNVPFLGLVGTDAGGNDQQTMGNGDSNLNTVYNPMSCRGVKSGSSWTTDASYEALLVQGGINALMATGTTHSTGYYFYTIPNPCALADDNRQVSGGWTVRCTRLVIEAQIGSTYYYYTITIPAMKRNNSYNYDSIEINQVGSLNPEEDTPGALTYAFTVTQQDGWDYTYNVNETI